MAIVCTLLAICLGIGAWRAKDEGGIRVFWFVCAMLNAAAATSMVASDFDHTWRLMPSESGIDPGYHYKR
jgi:hypothetical protein